MARRRIAEDTVTMGLNGHQVVAVQETSTKPIEPYAPDAPDVPETLYQRYSDLLNTEFGMSKDDITQFFSEHPQALLALQHYSDTGDLQVFKREMSRITHGDSFSSSYYQGILDSEVGAVGESKTYRDNYANLEEYFGHMDSGNTTEFQDARFEAMMKYIPQLAQAWQAYSTNEWDAVKAQQKFNIAMGQKQIANIYKYSENVSNLVDIYGKARRSAAGAAEVVGDINQKAEKLGQLKSAKDKYAAGDRSDSVLSFLASNTKYSKQQLNAAKKGSELAEAYVQGMNDTLQGGYQNLLDQANVALAAMMPQGFDVGTIMVNGSVDMGALKEALGSQCAALIAIMAALAGATISVVGTGNEAHLEFTGGTGGLTSGQIPRGGGGGGKSAAQKLIEKQKHETDQYNHLLKMNQYEQTRYQNGGYLTMYGQSLKEQAAIMQDRIPVIHQNIAQLQKQLKKTKQGSDDWYTLRDAINAAYEQLEQTNNALEENTRKQKENQAAIRQTKIDLQDMLQAEFENRKNKDREMLSSYVQIQDLMLEAIRDRYRKEWELKKEDIEKQKQALQEYKNLLSEKLNARKQTADTAAKYEQLVALKEQLALIEMDSTRTKDAIDLRKKITDLEQELNWQSAERRVEIEQDATQQQIDASDAYITKRQEDLERFLEDANNFAAYINGIIGQGSDALIDWLTENVEDFKNSTKEAQQQLIEGWKDMYKAMKGWADTYWDQIAEILGDHDAFISFMHESDEYKNASEAGKAALDEQYQDRWQAYIKARQVLDTSESDNVGTTAITGTTSTGGSGKPKPNTNELVQNGVNVATNALSNALQSNAVVNAWQSAAQSAGQSVAQSVIDQGLLNSVHIRSQQPYDDRLKKVQGYYSEGGVVDFTGLAMVHGSPLKPQAFLSAEDTAMMRSFLDAAKYISVNPAMSFIDPSSSSHTQTTVGDINVTLNVDKLQDDADYEQVARRVGEVFTKEFSKQGMYTANFMY